MIEIVAFDENIPVKLPVRATHYSAGYDLFLPSLPEGGFILDVNKFTQLISLGIKWGPRHDKNWFGVLMGRSSLDGGEYTKVAGLIDGDFPLEWKLKVIPRQIAGLKAGEKVAQVVFYELPDQDTNLETLSAARVGGFGSTDGTKGVPIGITAGRLPNEIPHRYFQE